MVANISRGKSTPTGAVVISWVPRMTCKTHTRNVNIKMNLENNRDELKMVMDEIIVMSGPKHMMNEKHEIST